jgi:hypothetical protein
MTVKELKASLARLDDGMKVAVYGEENNRQCFYEIDDVALAKGRPVRAKNNKPGFRFDDSGPATWMFLKVTTDF